MAGILKVDTIQNANASNIVTQTNSTTLTIGAAGQTVSLAAGAINNLGGGVDWETTPKTANFNAEAGKGYFVDTTSNSVIATLPTGVVGKSVTILDYVSNANTNPIYFSPQSGEKIEGNTAGQAVTANRQATTLTYSGAAQGWLVSSSGDSGPIVAPVITFNTASGSLGTLDQNTRTNPNGNLLPVTATTTFGTLNYAIQSGSLPAGLTLNSSTGAFVGSADAVLSETTSNFTVRASVTQTGTFLDRAFSITMLVRLFVTATGGTITTSGDYKIHSFTGPGTFTVSCAGNASGSNSVDYLIIAGGGSSSGDGAGGAGAGGYRINYPNPATGGTPVTATGYPIVVGAGGSAVPINAAGNPGSDSSALSITSAGGGGSGGGNGTPDKSGRSGGSGGGGGARGGSGGSGNTPPVSPSQGNNGAPGASPAPGDNGGGGGGSGGAGSIPCGSGGPGRSSDITGSSINRAGGGGGGGGPGRASGGSACTPSGATPGSNPGVGNASDATANTGSGAGGGGMSARTGGSGGSGIVIIRYKYQ